MHWCRSHIPLRPPSCVQSPGAPPHTQALAYCPLPPGEDRPGDDHDPHDLQQQTEDRGEARHATVPARTAPKQTCAEEAGSNPAEQSGPNKPGRAVWPWARRMLAMPH